MDFDSLCERFTKVENSVIKIEEFTKNIPIENNIFLLSFTVPASFPFENLSEEKKQDIVKSIIQSFKSIFTGNIKIAGRHAIIWGIDKQSLREKLDKVIESMRNKNIPLHICVKEISDRNSIPQAITDIERSLFMPFCGINCGADDYSVKFC